jgi:hypothetical protein
MILKQTQYATNFWLNNYLSHLDLVYKYKLLTPYKIPKLEKIFLSLNLNKILLNKTNNQTTNTQHLLFFFLFSLFTTMPFIKITSLSTTDTVLKNNETDCSLLLSFLTNKQMEVILFLYFIEIWSYIVKNKYKFLFKKPFLLKTKTFVELKTKMPLKALSNFNIFFNPMTNQWIKEDSTFFITFKFKNLIFLNSENCIKNLPFFWKNI